MLNDFLPEQSLYKSEASMLLIVSRPDWGGGEGEDAKCAALYSSFFTKHTWLRPCAGYTQELVRPLATYRPDMYEQHRG